MEWSKPEYTRSQVNKAGLILAFPSQFTYPLEDDDKDFAEMNAWLWANKVLSNWRACHGYPVNTFQSTLRNRLKSIDPNAIVAQRLKRAPSVIAKLRRYKNMQLARMHDIVGLRAVVDTIENVRKLENLYLSSSFKHQLVHAYDYIQEPQETGYRSIHLVYRYKNTRIPYFDGLQIELQIRTKLQHAWATAVETMGTFLGQALKSSQGESEWLKFFEMTAAAFACIENSPLVPGYHHLSRRQIFDGVAKAEKRLEVLKKLSGFNTALRMTSSGSKSGNYHLIILNSETMSVEVATYGVKRLDDANIAYSVMEKRISDGEKLEVVLVSAGPIDTLRKAYPNYFLDTEDFIQEVKKIIQASRDLPAGGETKDFGLKSI